MDWAARYAAADTPWDVGAPHPELNRRLAAGELRPDAGDAAFVPGCGRGHDATALAAAGYRVTGVDLVPELEKLVTERLRASGGRFVLADALRFNTEEPFQLLWEHTFFSAITPSDRALYGAMARRLVAPGGRLVALAFPADRPTDLDGPPFRTSPDDLAETLEVGFRMLSSAPVETPVACRRWSEHWVEFERLEGDP